jgi:hypothetical protein
VYITILRQVPYTASPDRSQTYRPEQVTFFRRLAATTAIYLQSPTLLGDALKVQYISFERGKSDHKEASIRAITGGELDTAFLRPRTCPQYGFGTLLPRPQGQGALHLLEHIEGHSLTRDHARPCLRGITEETSQCQQWTSSLSYYQKQKRRARQYHHAFLTKEST